MLRPLEKELVFFGASVAAGCKPCMDYHIDQLRVARADDEEIRQAIADAAHVRSSAQQIMESYGLALTGIAREVDTPDLPGEMTRIRALVCTAAAFALNCTSNLEKHIAQARALGVTDAEVSSVLKAALRMSPKCLTSVPTIVQRPYQWKNYHLLSYLYLMDFIHPTPTPSTPPQSSPSNCPRQDG